MSDKIGTFAELRELIHVSLRTRMNPIATVQMNSRPTAEFSPPPCPKLHVVKDAAEIGMELSTRWASCTAKQKKRSKSERRYSY
jgi:hypothetical protein